MNKIVLDPELRAKLNGLNEQVELCDESGRAVGQFLPTALYEELFYSALAAETSHSKEELRRRHRETGGRPLADLWKRLGVR